MNVTKALIVLVRLPLTGRVKPRLAAKLTSALAIKFYRCCAEHVITKSAKCEVIRYLFYSDGSPQQAEEWMRSIGQESMQMQAQTTWADAGSRIIDAFQRVFTAGASAVVLICSDVPDLDANIISNAFTALETSDVVFGPAHDGGCYLIGLKSQQISLFKEIPWGTKKVLQTSVSRANSLGLTVAPLTDLPCLYDVDSLESLVNWMDLPSSKISPLYVLVASILAERGRLLEALAETGYALVSP